MTRQKNRYLKLVSTGIGALGGLATAAFGVSLGGGLTGAQHRTDPAEAEPAVSATPSESVVRPPFTAGA